MNKMLVFGSLLLLSSGCFAQVVGRVDKKAKEFSIASGQKVDYMVFGFQFANATTQKLICFASNENLQRANSACRPGLILIWRDCQRGQGSCIWGWQGLLER